ncbi:MAG: FAD-dependent oxidoreductase [Methylophaga sp.]|jgi:ferredoxin--NADP+ reductase|uniref:FAD-dependent oxidoreductase n=1 Tax=Methylophaga sp. TaxID=2024840 RepID=UPI000C0C6FB4|nr:FAD-dependent oxidoreductase [Methylophaga sp.]MBL1456329.1 FAD-dependent oxidoreductase [Methylophaga sp.]
MNNVKEHPLQVAIIGSGPSGFYVAEALLNSGISTEITILEKLPCPYGLIRYGVAPDHQKLKSVSQTLDVIAEHPSVTYLGNVEVGRDIQTNELMQLYHVLVFTTGMPKSSQLGIEGESLIGVNPSSNFIGWYNGHPDYQSLSFDFNSDSAVIIGHGNVAIDICRVLAKPIDELRKSDIPEQALDLLSQSKINHINLVGRRGPIQAKFTTKELHELGKLENCNVAIHPKHLELGDKCQQELEEISNLIAKKNHRVFETYSSNFTSTPDTDKKQITIDFMLNPKIFKGDKQLQSIVFEKTRFDGPAFKQVAIPSDDLVEMPGGLVFTCVGFKGSPFAGLTIDNKKGTLSNKNSRLINEHGEIVPGMYTAGWVKRGPNGVIGTNRECAQDTVNHIVEDMTTFVERPAYGKNSLIEHLQAKNIQVVTFNDWKVIDAVEKEQGQKLGKPREKFTSVSSMLACL